MSERRLVLSLSGLEIYTDGSYVAVQAPCSTLLLRGGADALRQLADVAARAAEKLDAEALDHPERLEYEREAARRGGWDGVRRRFSTVLLALLAIGCTVVEQTTLSPDEIAQCEAAAARVCNAACPTTSAVKRLGAGLEILGGPAAARSVTWSCREGEDCEENEICAQRALADYQQGLYELDLIHDVDAEALR